MGVFLGWMADAATQAELARLRARIEEALPAGAPRHDWRSPAQWHMTLRYLGETVDASQRARIDAAMAGLAAGQPAAGATLVGAEYWPDARVLVATIAASDALTTLLEQLESTMQACGFASERPQTAHVTLAYLPRVAAPPALPALAMAQPLHVDRVQLLQTAPGTYASLAAWPLAGPSAA